MQVPQNTASHCPSRVNISGATLGSSNSQKCSNKVSTDVVSVVGHKMVKTVRLDRNTGGVYPTQIPVVSKIGAWSDKRSCDNSNN